MPSAGLACVPARRWRAEVRPGRGSGTQPNSKETIIERGKSLMPWTQGAHGGQAAARKDVSSILLKSEKTVAALLESASQAIVSVDRDGRIVLANARTEEMFGYARGELLGSTIEMLLPQAVQDAHVEKRAGYFHRPKVRPMGIGMDLSARRKDGSEFPVEVSLSYVETEEGTFAMAFVSDISQRKRLEEQLLHAQKMEAVGRLAGGVAHDFNNMLTIISGYNRMIMEKLPPSDPLRSHAEEVLKAADRAGELTNQLLAFSRRQILKPRIINVNALLATTEKMLRRLIGEDIQLELKLAPSVANIKADPGQLEHAIFNLAANSRDAMPAGGYLTIETRVEGLDSGDAARITTAPPENVVVIAVSDTGHGMDDETKRRVFEPFFTTKERGKGTGLGLASVYGIVKQSGGDVSVVSEPGKGTTFKLCFPPVLDPVTESSGSGTTRPKYRSTEVLLVVEDEAAVRNLIATMLQQLGYTVLAAGSGREAIEIGEKHKSAIAMLLTDMVMPEMNGPQLAHAIRARRPDTKILYLARHTDSAIVDLDALNPSADFLPKPFTQEALGKKVRELLGTP